MKKTQSVGVQNHTEMLQVENNTTQQSQEEISTLVYEEITIESNDDNTIENTTPNANSDDSNVGLDEDSTKDVEVDKDFVSRLKAAQNVNQMIVVSASGSNAIVTMHERDNSGIWHEILATSGFVGSNGVGKASEEDTKTPAGVFTLGSAFGIKDNPGTTLNYTKVDGSHYWVDDPYSLFYNKFVNINKVTVDWKSAEHIIEYPIQYAYVIPIDYNLECIPGDGSAIFLHCSNNKPTAGCVSVPEKEMLYFLTHIRKGCVIIIDNADAIFNY